MTSLTALALCCSLKPGPEGSSTMQLAQEVLDELATLGVTGSAEHVLDHDVLPGVGLDEGEGDGWPALRERVLAADVLVLATPIWMGQPSSVAKRVLERLDADVAETDEDGRPTMFGKVAVVAVVGNEDGAHHVAAECFQALGDVGFTIPPQATTYWVGEAMGSTDYRDLDERPEKTQQTTRTAARNAAHLAGLLKDQPLPVPG